MKKSLIVVTLLFLSALLWQCGENKQAPKTAIKIGALLPLTGGGASYGKSLKQGIEMAVNEINASGGISGRQLEVIYEDSKTDPKEGISAFNKLASVDKVPVVICSISSIILSVQPIADEKKIVLLNTSAISPKICDKADNFLFSIMVNGATEAQFMANRIREKYPREKIAVFYSNNSSGNDTKTAFINKLEMPENVTTIQSYELKATDFRVQLNNIKNSKAKIGYLIAFSNSEFANILIQSKELGLDIQWYSYSAIETKETLTLVRNAGEGVIYSYPAYDTTKNMMEDFQNKYETLYHNWADIYTITSYEGVKLIGKVIEENGGLSTDIQKGLRNIKSFEGVFGKIDFVNKQCVDRTMIWKTIKGGSFQLYQKKK